jgi:hypothetical protein
MLCSIIRRLAARLGASAAFLALVAPAHAHPGHDPSDHLWGTQVHGSTLLLLALAAFCGGLLIHARGRASTGLSRAAAAGLLMFLLLAWMRA